ncbi:MAG: hypothetical protein KF680_01905 [Cryobacterium sp.]|nr:hypothetical protein [Cryobacterium sp.]
MDRLLPALIVAALLALALGLMWWGWHRRQRRQGDLPRLAAVPADAGTEQLRVAALYVATTMADAPLDRIAVGGLGYRAKAHLAVRERGLELEIPGQDGLFIPATDLEDVFRSRNTIDRAVERDGLIALRYRIAAAAASGEGAEPLAVDSYLRIVDPVLANEFVATVTTLIHRAGSTRTGIQ